MHALHAAHAGYNAVVITTDDTDVLILCLGFNNDIPSPIHEKRGTQSRTQFFVVGKVARALGHDICDALVGVHACGDTVSACAGRGKMRILKHVKTNKTYEEAFCWLG